MTGRDIACEEAIRRLAAYLDRELQTLARDEVDRHLEACRSCYSRAQFERELRSRIRALGQQPVDPAFEERICEIVQGFRAERDGGVSSSSAGI